MTQTAVNWQTIKTEWENGDSERVLSVRHGVPRTTIQSRATTGQWNRANTFRPFVGVAEPAEPPDDGDLIALARYALSKLAVHLKHDLDLREHKLFADALSQYSKVIASQPDLQQLQGSYIAPDIIAAMSEQDREIMKRIFTDVEARLAALSNITPIRKA